MDLILSNKFAALLRTAQTQYGLEVSRFADFVASRGQPLGPEVTDAYLVSLKKKTHKGADGYEVSYSAEWINRQIKGVKSGIRWALDHWPEGLDEQHYRTAERFLKSIKMLKVKRGIHRADLVPTVEEFQQLLDKSHPQLRLILRFLRESGCRISEAVKAEVGSARRGKKLTSIAVIGKGGKARDLRITTALFDEIVGLFKGKRYLFEHTDHRKGELEGKPIPYHPIGTSQQIKRLALRVLKKPVTAHMLRHLRGTELSEKLGISKAASELGITIGVAKNHYDHSAVSADEFLDSLE